MKKKKRKSEKRKKKKKRRDGKMNRRGILVDRNAEKHCQGVFSSTLPTKKKGGEWRKKGRKKIRIKHALVVVVLLVRDISPSTLNQLP